MGKNGCVTTSSNDKPGQDDACPRIKLNGPAGVPLQAILSEFCFLQRFKAAVPQAALSL